MKVRERICNHSCTKALKKNKTNLLLISYLLRCLTPHIFNRIQNNPKANVFGYRKSVSLSSVFSDDMILCSSSSYPSVATPLSSSFSFLFYDWWQYRHILCWTVSQIRVFTILSICSINISSIFNFLKYHGNRQYLLQHP